MFCFWELWGIRSRFFSSGDFEQFITVKVTLTEISWIVISSFSYALKPCDDFLAPVKRPLFCESSESDLCGETVSLLSLGTVMNAASCSESAVRIEASRVYAVVLKVRLFQFFTYELKCRYELYQLFWILFGQIYLSVFLKQETVKVWDRFFYNEWIFVEWRRYFAV